MKINMGTNIIIETEIPFLNFQFFTMKWEINEHAVVQIKGIVNSHIFNESDKHIYSESNIKISVIERDLNEKVIFRGLVTGTEYTNNNGVMYISIKAKSATIQLDNQKLCCSFQCPSETYENVIKNVLSEGKGNVITTVERKKIGKPLICYKETAWEFIKRVASAQNKYIIPDVVTGKVNVWFGMRKGIEIKDSVITFNDCINIKKNYTQREYGRSFKSYIMKSDKTYLLGDYINKDGQTYIIYQKNAQLEKSELSFNYKLAKDQDIMINKYYNKKFIGLSLLGSIESTKNEVVNIKYKIDGKESEYFYPWMPETGNCMYTMPEKDSIVAVQFVNHDEREGIAVRSLNFTNNSQSNENSKILEIPVDGKVTLHENKLEVLKKKNLITMADDSMIKINGENIKINSNGRLKIHASSITLNAKNEIKAMADGN